MSKKIMQISFGKDSDLSQIREELTRIKNEYSEYYTFAHCFLPRHVVEEKGWSTQILDLLDEVLGKDNHHSKLEEFKTFDECMKNLEDARKSLTNEISCLAILGLPKGVLAEINTYSRKWYDLTEPLIFYYNSRHKDDEKYLIKDVNGVRYYSSLSITQVKEGLNSEQTVKLQQEIEQVNSLVYSLNLLNDNCALIEAGK